MEKSQKKETLQLEIDESYYIQSKFKFHVVAPAVVDENDYYG